MDRRRFLGAMGVAAAGTALSACGGVGNAAGKPGATVKPPVSVPFTGVKADLAGEASVAIPPGFYHYPANPVQFVSHPPGDGGPVSMLLQADSPPLSLGSNRWWQALNRALNAQVNINVTPFSQYNDKFTVVTAGRDIPDVAMIAPIPGELQILEKEFTDLSPYLSGDKVKEYPGLASFPTPSWQVSTLGGRIWGVPQPRPASGAILNYRGDLLEQHGIASPDLRDGKDLLNLCKELTDSKHNVWALGEQPTGFILPLILEMLGAPNSWELQGGKFTSVYESEQMKEALNIVTQIWSSGYVEPDSFASPADDYAWWEGGRISLLAEQVANWGGLMTTYPSFKIGVIRLPKWNGGGYAKKLLTQAGYGDFVGFKKASPKRIRELLRITNYLAAPFGTKEFLTVNYGVSGWDYQLRGSDPVPTSKAKSETLPIAYAGSQGLYALYSPLTSDNVKTQYEYLKAVMPTGVHNPTQGLYSPTSLTTGASAAKTLQNVEEDIIQGRSSISAWDSAVKTWRQQAGDKMAREYEQAYAKLHP